MHPRVRAALLACAAFAALAPSSGAAALAAPDGPAVSHTAAAQALTWSVVPSPNREINGHIHSNEPFTASPASLPASAPRWATTESPPSRKR
jgi:hypothetical protein